MNNTYLNGLDFNVGIYIRLSQEDKGKLYESDSESVINQKELLRNYVKSNNFNLVKEYVDDGFSGTDFERPGFQSMLEDINNKKINCVIVKDLSRLGRDHVMTGYYIETFFPENNIRFISILESYDSFKNQASNDSSTFIIACNDYYSKQNSIKIRNVLNNKRKRILEQFEKCKTSNKIYDIEKLNGMLCALRQIEPEIFPEIYNYIKHYDSELKLMARNRFFKHRRKRRKFEKNKGNI